MPTGQKKTNKEFIEEVSRLVGDEYTFLERYKTAKTKIDVIHNVCGHEYKVCPDKFTSAGRRCPKCSGKHRPTTAEFVARAKVLVGDDYTFLGEYATNKDKIPVRHEVCGYEYEVAPSHFLSGKRCPDCHGTGTWNDKKFKEKVTGIAGEEYVFLGKYEKSRVPLPIRHKTCGRVSKISPNNFFNGARCTHCNYSKGENEVQRVLENLGVEYERQWKIGGRLKADFYLPEYRAIIEYDGEQHFRPVYYWGGDEEYKNIRFRDSVKNHYCEYTGIKLLRLPYWKKPEIETLVLNFLESNKERKMYFGDHQNLG